MISIPLLNPVFRLVMRIISMIVFLLTIISAYGGKFNPEYLYRWFCEISMSEQPA